MNIALCIGARDCPWPEVQYLADKVGYWLGKLNWAFRSGKAKGLDSWFEAGFKKSGSKNYTIYLPENNFNGGVYDGVHYFDATLFDTYEMAKMISKKYHPNWGKLNSFGVKAMTRNYYQMFGHEDVSPKTCLPSLIFCWTEKLQIDNENRVSNANGGTGQAIRMGYHNRVPIIHFNYAPHYEACLKMVAILDKAESTGDLKTIANFDILQFFKDSGII